jgi:LmbE family N-acetylglucosaminyl deacetylase
MTMKKVALSILSHPDDAEFVCSGTMDLLRQKGWEIHIATLSPGNCGSATIGPEEISAIRRKEGAAAAKVLDGTYHCLECEDAFIRNDKETVLKTIELIRRVKPTVIFAASPSDYLYDHEATSLIGRDATFWCSVPNIKTPGVDPLASIPHLYYCDPIDCADIFGEPIVPTIAVDISSVIDTKCEMLALHASQRDWLLKHHGVDEYTISMKGMGEIIGAYIGCEYAEGFRQHVGNAYPKDDILSEVLGAAVHKLKK